MNTQANHTVLVTAARLRVGRTMNGRGLAPEGDRRALDMALGRLGFL